MQLRTCSGAASLFLSLRSTPLPTFDVVAAECACRSGLGAQVGLALKDLGGLSLRSTPLPTFDVVAAECACRSGLGAQVGLALTDPAGLSLRSSSD